MFERNSTKKERNNCNDHNLIFFYFSFVRPLRFEGREIARIGLYAGRLAI